VKRLRSGFFVLAIAVAGAAAGVAAADPGKAPRSAPVTITCGNTTYDAVVNGNGVWSPAHDLNSNSTIIPVAFGVATNVFTDPGGTIHTSTDPATAKGSSAPEGAPLLDCSYHLALSFPDGSSLVVDGTATGFVTPANG
jgi:hypothetical protein